MVTSSLFPVCVPCYFQIVNETHKQDGEQMSDALLFLRLRMHKVDYVPVRTLFFEPCHKENTAIGFGFDQIE
jgi:hypothetical protein